MKKRLLGPGALVCLVVPFVISCATHRTASAPPPAEKAGATGLLARMEAEEGEGERELVPPALERKLAEMARFSPENSERVLDSPGSYAEQDWLEHNTDGRGNTPTPAVAFERARRDWSGFRGRGEHSLGPWTPLGPTNGVGDLDNPYRDRTVYNAGTQNFGGRTVDAVISPDCRQWDCDLWIANANGGVWHTGNALAEDDPSTGEYEGPDWEYVSEEFDHNNVSALALDPNDSRHQTLWAGTGEPNACGSGCEIGVGVYVSKNGGQSWKGPLGQSSFNARAVGSIAVKPGDGNTIFAASGRAVRGVSNTCCGGTDALIPGAPHFGLYRSQDGGRSWQLVNQGAPALCTASHPDDVSLNLTPCSPRGARRVRIDPVDPNTVYATFFARGIWRSRSNGDPGTWEQIMAPVGPVGTTERAEFDVVKLPGTGETRMYVGVGGGSVTLSTTPPQTVGVAALFRRNDAVRNTDATAARAAWLTLTNPTPDTPGYSSFGYCDPQCSYDNYVYVPAAHSNQSGANADTVYLSGANQYNENNTGTGRSNGRAVGVSTDGGASFSDMTEDDTDSAYPGALHPDHHALLTNPRNWKQFFDFSDGGVNRSNGVFVNDAADCSNPPHSFAIPSRLLFCQTVALARVPQRLDAINRGLRTLHFYQLEYDRKDPSRISAGAQDNGSWETLGSRRTWVNVNVADGGHNSYDPRGGDPQFALTAWQSGQLEVRYDPLDQSDVNWIADTLFVFYGNEAVPFTGNAITDPVMKGWLWHGREHAFRSTNWGRNPILTKETHRLHCNVWYGDGDVDNNGVYEAPTDLCDDFKPLGDPGPDGRLTSPTRGDRAGGHVAVLERAYSDRNTLWAATSTGRVFVSKNANDPNPALVTFARIDDTDTDDPPRYPTAIFVDRSNPNHAWITYSGYNSKTPATPGHIFEVTFHPATGSAAATGTFTNRDGSGPFAYGDIPANSIVATNRGTLFVGNDYGVVANFRGSGSWRRAAPGLPNMDVPDLIYVPERRAIYAATHGQGAWKLDLDADDDDGRDDDHHGRGHDDDDDDGHGDGHGHGHGGHH
jgi:hypothetical protein